VAKLAGVPQQLLAAAEEKLMELEGSGVSIDLENYVSSIKEAEIDPKAETEQISFFSFAPNPVVERLKALDLLNITPSQAFGILEELKKATEI
jgi:DNA mismatch repair protein MutS